MTLPWTRRSARCGAGLLLAAALSACATVPGTGRRQLRLLSLESELNLGAQAFASATAEARLITSGPGFDAVQSVGLRVSRAARKLYPNPARHFSWQFVLVDDPEVVNAWALPGGKCAVYSGLLDVAGGEAALAVVMGHEVAHAVAHHGAERISQNMLTQGLMMGADIYLGSRDVDPQRHDRILNALGITTTLGVLLPYSRKHETEADELGLFLAAAAGYDPREALAFWERMGRASGPAPPRFLSTHPSEGQRIRRLRRHMKEALRHYEQALGQAPPG